MPSQQSKKVTATKAQELDAAERAANLVGAEEFVNLLCPEDCATRDGCDFPVAESVGNGALKDEPRQKEKVDEVSTRLFISVCMHEFFVQRRYFGDIVKCWSSCTTGVSSALGVSPRDFDIFFHFLG